MSVAPARPRGGPIVVLTRARAIVVDHVIMTINEADPRYQRYLMFRSSSHNGMFLRFTDEDPADLIEPRAVMAFATRDDDGAMQVVAAHAIPDLVSLIDELLPLAGYELPT